MSKGKTLTCWRGMLRGFNVLAENAFWWEQKEKMMKRKSKNTGSFKQKKEVLIYMVFAFLCGFQLEKWGR